MSMSDPVLFPEPLGTAEALRQDVARTRQDLAQTIVALAERFDVPAAARRGVAASIPTAVRIGGAAGAGTAGYVASRWTILGRLSRAALAAGVSALAYVAITRIQRGRGADADPSPMVIDQVADPSPMVIDQPVESAALAASPAGGDVVDVLMAQHRQVRHLFDRVAAADGSGDRREAIATLVAALHRHEYAEQEIVHPALRDLPGGTTVLDERLAEEAAADRTIAALISRGPDDRHFDRSLADLRAAVEAHATAEETDEFPLLRAQLPIEQRQRMANQVRAGQTEPW